MSGDRRTPCARLPVLLIGPIGACAPLRDLLSRRAHPVHHVGDWTTAEAAVARMRVVVSFPPLPAAWLERVERLHAHSPGLRVLLAVERLGIDIEEQVMQRGYLHVTVAGRNLEALHALVHDVLHVTHSPTPLALDETHG